MAFLYILRTGRGGYYIGSTTDIDARLAKHTSGGVRSTRSLRPLTLVYKEECVSRGVAQQREYEIKKWKSKQRILKIIYFSPELNYDVPVIIRIGHWFAIDFGLSKYQGQGTNNIPWRWHIKTC